MLHNHDNEYTMLIAWQGRAFAGIKIWSITVNVIYSIHQPQFDGSGWELRILFQILVTI